MTLLDSDVLLIEVRYKNDARFAINHQTLQQLRTDSVQLGVTSQVLLETVGILSFNIPARHIAQLPQYLTVQFGLTVLPDIQLHPEYAGCSVQEVITQICQKMAVGDAVQAVQIARYASFSDCLLSWNAKHFQGKLAVPVLTPQEWLQQRLGSAP